MKRKINWSRIAAYLIYYIGGSILMMVVIIGILIIPELIIYLLGW